MCATILIIAVMIVTAVPLRQGEEIPVKFLGCFQNNRLAPRTYRVPQFTTETQCIDECKAKFYMYSYLSAQLCTCSNYLGEELNSTAKCVELSGIGKGNLSDVYATGNQMAGPPTSVKLTNLTDHSLHVAWDAPESYTEIASYQIKATVLHSYSNYAPNSPVWHYSNDTFRTELITLQPATKYNVTIQAISASGAGAPVSRIIETRIGVPDCRPDRPEVLKNQDGRMEIKITPVINNNGPISSYLIVVVNNDAGQVFQEGFLKKYDEAKSEGISYYIAAEIDPKEVNRNFIVGDGRYYGKYFNAPLIEGASYTLIVGVTSELNGEVKRTFGNVIQSPPFEDTQEFEDVDPDSPALVVGLSIAIGLLSFVLIGGIVGFLILKSRITNNRQRFSDNQELTLQGPVIEVENNGYLPEDEVHVPVSSKAIHYRQLKEKVRSIPYNQLKIEPSNLLGIGRFGRVTGGSIYEGDTQLQTAVYSIPDKKLGEENKKAMLHDLGVLIRVGQHDNLINLIGTCETKSTVFIILEYHPLNLKDLLLGSRDSLAGRFSNMTEQQALNIAIDVAKGMAHLESLKIIHKQLCARSIMISNETTPKISGFGLSQYYNNNNLPDYSRWTALEVFRGFPQNARSDIWSFGCLLWEIAVLGGTPYGNFSNNEIPDRIIKGLRLPQLQYFGDDLYQIMLDCWQIDVDERPTFGSLVESLRGLKENALMPYLNFNMYSNFQYEQFYPDMEIAVRPVF